MIGVSVILCCYNSAKRIEKTLQHLALQNVSNNAQWEVILVDNNSSDNTIKLAKELWKAFNNSIKFKVVEEKKAGLTFARKKGMSEAKFSIYLFCDDDNWLRNDYVENVLLNFIKIPNLGAVGGWSEPVFEGEKPEWFDTFSGNFAVGKPVQHSGCLNQTNQFIYGAGMALSKNAMLELTSRGFKNILSDRKGKQLSSGGDVELIYAIKLIGKPVVFDDKLFLFHFMSTSRMTWDYLIRLRASMYWSNFVLNIYIDALKGDSLGFKSLIKNILQRIKYLYTQSRYSQNPNTYEVLFLKNQIEVKKLFLKNIIFYYKTRLALKKVKHG